MSSDRINSLTRESTLFKDLLRKRNSPGGIVVLDDSGALPVGLVPEQVAVNVDLDIASIDGLQIALDSKLESADLSSLESAIAGKADVVHGHIIADITGLQAELDFKSEPGHVHTISDVTNLQTSLDNKSDITHTHSGLIPTGGTTGQVVKKNSNTAYDFSWGDVTGGSGDSFFDGGDADSSYGGTDPIDGGNASGS